MLLNALVYNWDTLKWLRNALYPDFLNVDYISVSFDPFESALSLAKFAKKVRQQLFLGKKFL